MRRACRTSWFSVLGAVLGFSYALATSNPGASSNADSRLSKGFSARSVGQDLRFTNPFLSVGSDPAYPNGGDVAEDPDGFDLGDACLETEVTRYITAAGGFQPYRFKAKPLFDDTNLGSNTFFFPKVSALGKLTGVFSGTGPSALRFKASVTEFMGHQRLGTFRLNLLPCPAEFRFAQSVLPTAQMGKSYFTHIETLGGTAPVRFSVKPDTVMAGTVVQTGLESVGLSLGTDGTIMGRPSVSGTITFDVQAVDAKNSPALSRNLSVTNQRFVLTVTVETIPQVTSEVLATKCLLMGFKSALAVGSDHFTYSGFLDTKGENALRLAGSPFVLHIGTASFAGIFDARGRVETTFGEKGRLSVRLVAPGGRLSIKLSDVDLTSAIDADSYEAKTTDKDDIIQTKNIVIGMEVGVLRTSEVLVMNAEIRSDRYKLSYAMGTRGFSMTGGFQIITVQGTDAAIPEVAPAPGTERTFGDRWLVRFLAVPAGIDSAAATKAIAGSTSITLRIGDNFSQTVTVAPKSVRSQFKATGKDPGIYKLLLDPKRFVHRLETNVLSPDDTGVVPALQSKTPTIFSLGMDITGYSGEAGRVIIPNKGTWVQQ